MPRRILFTCEHGGNRVPAAYRELFRGADKVLASHRGWDPGALSLAKVMQARWKATLFSQEVTRLLVELNRSLGHARLFSEFTEGLAPTAKQSILDRFYSPYRGQVEQWIHKSIQQQKPVVHISVHTFTPVWDGELRNADVGLLYDPARKNERQFCDRWRAAIRILRPDLRVRRNYPYLGKADGLTTYLRRQFPTDLYLGVELEVNQAWVDGGSKWTCLKRDLANSQPLSSWL